MTKKEAAIEFLSMVARGQIEAAYERFIASEFVHHNQYFRGDRLSLMLAMEEAGKKSPDKKLEVKQAFQDGDFVITHSLVRQHPDDLGGAVVHIFKFRGDRVIELWDLGQQLIKDSPNENGPF